MNIDSRLRTLLKNCIFFSNIWPWRLQPNGSENDDKTTKDKPLAGAIESSAANDSKKAILNSTVDPTAQQNTTNNSKPVPTHASVPKKLTDYFPIRRSVRKTKQEMEREFLHQVEKALDRDVEEGLVVKNFPNKGRGIVATRKFYRGDFVVEYLGDLIDQAEAQEREEFYAKDTKFGCYMYYFKYKEQQWW